MIWYERIQKHDPVDPCFLLLIELSSLYLVQDDDTFLADLAEWTVSLFAQTPSSLIGVRLSQGSQNIRLHGLLRLGWSGIAVVMGSNLPPEKVAVVGLGHLTTWGYDWSPRECFWFLRASKKPSLFDIWFLFEVRMTIWGSNTWNRWKCNIVDLLLTI